MLIPLRPKSRPPKDLHPAPRGLSAVLWVLLLLAPGCGDDPTPPQTACGDPGILCTVLGNGVSAYEGEGAPPDQVSLYWPIDLEFDAQARLLVLDWNNFRIRRLDHDGRVRTIVGTGFESEEFQNGKPALETTLHHTFSMSYDGAGNLYLAGNHSPVILRLEPDDSVWAAAGTPSPGYTGDGGPALEATLETPCGVAAAQSGFPVYLADTGNHCIRAIDAQGIIRTVAGDGQIGSVGDGGPATQARLHSPYRVRLDHSTGDLYVADVENHRIRRIDASGIITTVAGNGTAGYAGDDGPATLASIHSPLDARIGPDGFLYIADTRNHRIRRVDAAGVITTVAGTGTEGTPQDALTSGPARSVNLDHPAALAFGPDGNLYIADTYNSVVRRVRLEP